MFPRWHHVKVRAAERALEQGRLDDAYAVAVDPAVADDERARRLRDGLVRPLLARARLARQAGRNRDALADLDRLAALGRKSDEADSLRLEITNDVRRYEEAQAEEHAAQQRVAQRLQAGRLDSARADLADVRNPAQRAELSEELDRRAARGAALIDQAMTALDRDELLVAVRLWHESRARHGHTPEAEVLASRLVTRCRELLANWHRAGQIARILSVGEAVGQLLAYNPALGDGERVVELVRRAAAALAARDHASLRHAILRLQSAAGPAPWLEEVRNALAQLQQAEDVLLASPLGVVAGQTVVAPPAALPGTVDAPAPPASGDAARLNRPLLLLVDGGGSHLLLSQERIRIGRAGRTTNVDIPLPIDIDPHHADLVRQGDDYFIEAYGELHVNRDRVRRALLRDGDRVTLADGGRLVFQKPSGKSATAILRLSHRCRMRDDVSGVVLFRDMCVIGPDAGCHIRTRDAAGRVVLFERAGVLCARPAGAALQPGGGQPVVLGVPTDLGELRLTVRAFEVRGQNVS